MDRQQLIDDLITDEGVRLRPYVDTLGKVSIGVGRNLTDVGLTSAEVLYLLDNDIDRVLADLVTFPWFAQLDSVRQGVLANLRFNLGPLGFRAFRQMLLAVANGDFQRASAELTRSRWVHQVQPSRSGRMIAQLTAGTL